MYHRGSLHSPVYTLIAAVPGVTLKWTLHIVAIFVVLCVIYNLLLKVLCQD